jgi:ribosomal-protein-alanine N-acetyltransferase
LGIRTIPTLITDRTVLRSFTLDDAPAVCALAGDAAMSATTLNLPHPYPEEAAVVWIATHAGAAASGDGFTWAITHGAHRTLLGAISLNVTPRHARAELGYWLGVPFWNMGYMTEAARRIVTFGFADLGLHRVESSCFPRNPASARVMEKAGLRYEGLLRGYIHKDKSFEDVLIYARLQTDID